MLFALLTQAQSVTAQDEISSWCVSVWYPSSDDPGGADSILNNADVIHVVNPFWYTPAADGTLLAQPEAENAAQLAAWRERDLVILPSIFASLWTMLATEESRAAHVDEIVDLVERMDYDGIDIDYEGFAASTRDDFSDLIEALAEALHANERLLSVTVHAKTGDEGVWEGAAAQDWVRLAAVADIFNIMTYDYTNRNEPPGPIAPLEWTMDVLAYAETVTDLSKVRLGLPFYGYSWLRGRPPATTVTWAAAQRLITSFSLDVTRDASEGRIDLDVRSLPDQTMYFIDAASVTERLDAAAERFPSLGGVAIWGLGGEDPAVWDVMRAYAEGCSLTPDAAGN